jgi:uncharacterized protein (TIGR03435 family)
MHALDDIALLREFAERDSGSAFAELVARHINKVYSVALRYTRNPHEAEEIMQAVFVILARRAGTLGKKVILSGWLYQTARLVAVTYIRGEVRRARREQEAFMQTYPNENESDVWPHIAPLLDDAMARLREKDRHAVVLRFLDGKSMKEVGAALGASEDAAKMRVSRALEKLRIFFTKRGVDSTSATIAGTISANSIQAAPLALAKSVTAVAIAKGATASASTLTLIQGALKIMAWTKAKTAIVGGVVVLLAAGTTTITITKIKENERRTEELWRVNKDLPPDQIDELPPMVKVLPTKFPSVWVTWNSGANGDKFVGSNARAGDITAYAYGFPRGRIRFAGVEPTNRFDFVATLPQGSREALQHELKVKLGLVGRRETENMDVLLLKVNHPNAPGLKPPNLEENHTYWNNGVFHSSDAVMDTGAPRFDGMAEYLERYFKMPVIDQTGITQHFSVDMHWKEQKGHPNHEGLKQAMFDQLGLELVSTNMPIEMLVVEKAK